LYNKHVMKLPSVRWPVRAGNCLLRVEVHRRLYCRVVMPWWVVGEGVQCYYRVCETAGHHNLPEFRWT